MAKNQFLARFYTLKKAKNWNQSLSVVYGSIILKKKKICGPGTPIRTSDSTAKIIDNKSVFLGHPTGQHSQSLRCLATISCSLFSWSSGCILLCKPIWDCLPLHLANHEAPSQHPPELRKSHFVPDTICFDLSVSFQLKFISWKLKWLICARHHLLCQICNQEF